MFEGFFCGSDANACVVDFIQFCLLPRVLTSPMDALFCAEFVRALVRWEVKNYNHILFVKRALTVFLSLLRGVTENEALNVSIFLLEVFTDLCRWNESAKEYEAACAQNACFAKEWEKPEEARLSFEAYQKVGVGERNERQLYKHWMKLITVMIVSDLQSADLLHVRNALDFLQRVNSVYPKHSDNADALYPFLENLMLVSLMRGSEAIGGEWRHSDVCADAVYLFGQVEEMGCLLRKHTTRCRKHGRQSDPACSHRASRQSGYT